MVPIPASITQVFHEGLKSWSCCEDVNKPVLDFDEFMKIPGCTKGEHHSNAPEPQTPKPSANITSTTPQPLPQVQISTPVQTTTPAQTFTTKVASPTLPVPTPQEEEEDDLSIPVSPGTTCRHKGCGKVFVSDEVSRLGDGEGATCTYHPKSPIFHEGSKASLGYLCCKRRVLEFEEFLKIEGCKKGRHLFVPKNKNPAIEQFTECRIDHYQTPTEVHVSVFAKQTDKERSTVRIEAEQVSLDLYLPASKRFKRTIELFGPIDPGSSKYTFFGTKVELVLKKQDTRSWSVLEKTDRAVPMNLTFGVGGRTGTIGAKELVLDEQNATRTN
ncbi:hypothetical protein NM688_g8303 [Phlebia brevispora]|uniref:Uncharacterized protein n=1 Tax=Phlebia brevispora TaxID=194682 RepID=A0ACC1RUS3_9APHY|nr:hypothetical protein NM688_g8303 [Phlebia brevispora]